MEILEKNVNSLWGYVEVYGPKLLYAIIVLLVGLWVIKLITKRTGKMMEKSNMDESLRPFLNSLLSITLKTLLVITVLHMVGVAMASFIAILAAAGLAIGMALSGTLQNFAGGVMILIFKPFKVGEVIEAQGYLGVVTEIQIFVTIMNTPDNKMVIIPNGGLSTGSLINYSRLENRRVDFVFGIGYSDDIDKAKDILLKVAADGKSVLPEPAPFVEVSELADSSVNFTVRVWVKSENYWDAYFDLPEKVKKAFDAEGISIPFPQQDVHMYQQNS
ncbi:mechanosensitive ion channel [Puteibacter caeruleilacunae]|nr:mechanosensitive ion channel [Puteibacter caeruleilacunae]